MYGTVALALSDGRTRVHRKSASSACSGVLFLRWLSAACREPETRAKGRERRGRSASSRNPSSVTRGALCIYREDTPEYIFLFRMIICFLFSAISYSECCRRSRRRHLRFRYLYIAFLSCYTSRVRLWTLETIYDILRYILLFIYIEPICIYIYYFYFYDMYYCDKKGCRFYCFAETAGFIYIYRRYVFR